MTTYINGELAADFLRVSRSTMLRWAKRDGWQVRGENKSTEYKLEDVSKTYEKEVLQLLPDR